MLMSAVPVIYETPSRRQSFRVSSPAEVTIRGRRYRTKDWSAGGFAVEHFDEVAAPGDRLSTVTFAVDFQGFAISFCSEAKVIRAQDGLMAAEFLDLGEREHNLLGYFTSSLISGQIAPVDGVLKNLDRPVTKIAISPPAPANAPARRIYRRIIAAVLYLVIGLAILGFAGLIVVGHVTQVNVETAVTSATLEQVVSADVGTIAEMYIQPGMQVKAGQPLFRVDSELSARAVEQARQDLATAQIALKQATATREAEETKLRVYQSVSNDQLAVRKAEMVSLVAARDQARVELERYKKLLEYGVISQQLFDTQQATYDERAARVEQEIAEEKITESSIQSTVNANLFLDNANRLVGDLAIDRAAEVAARDQVKMDQEAVDVALRQDSKRMYHAAFPAVVLKIFKSRGMTVDRGEALVVLRPAAQDPYIDAYLTQDEAAQLAAGARGVATITANGKRYAVEVVAVDRTAGFLKDIQTPKLQEPVFQWRSIEDRSAYAKLAFVGLGAAERDAITPGLPVFVSIPRKRSFFSGLVPTVHAASPDAPHLWPADSPLFTGARVADPGFEPVRRRILEAADAALRDAPAPVETIHSAGETDQSDPEFQASRRAFEDADHFAALALAYRLTGKKSYADGARAIVAAWARVNRPTGMPIDETRLDAFLWGLDLLGADARDPAVTAWLERWASANRSYKFGPITATNNHKTHHLKILVMLDRLLGRDADYAKDLAAVEEQRKANLPSSDGRSIDYEQRDAMHYHIFDLEAWLEISLVTGCCGDSMDRSFRFFGRSMAENPGHLEFAKSTAAIDKKRAAGGFEYAKARPYDMKKAARAVFAYGTLPGRRVDRDLWRSATAGEQHDNLLYEARFYLWKGRQ